MDSAYPELQLAFSFDWEALLPILFFLLYGLSQFLGGRGEEDAEDESGSGKQGKGSEAKREAEERARRIREEIQRKMADRRQQAEGGRATQSAEQQRPAYNPLAPDGQQGAGSARRSEDRQPERAQRKEPARRPQTEPASDLFGSGQSAIERQLAEQRRRLEESRRKQEEAKAQAKQIQRKAGVAEGAIGSSEEGSSAARAAWGMDAIPSPGGLRSSLLKGIRDPREIRKAVLYREVLDPPVSMREQSQGF